MHDDKTNILLVDDRTENLLSLEAILEGLGQNLVKARSGTEALREVLRHDFAVILIDVQMPGMDGFETVDLIKERERSRYTPVIFLTALSRSDVYISKGYSVGAVDYMLKPIMPAILESKVSVFVELFRKSQEVKRLNEDLERRAGELAKSNSDLAKEIAERKRTEQQVRKLNEELEEKVTARTAQLSTANEELKREIAERKRLEKEKDEFLAMASHELRTPLTAVKGYAALALRAARAQHDERLIRTLDIVTEKSDQIRRLIDEMLDVSRIEQNVLSLACEHLDLADLVKTVVSRMELLSPNCLFRVETPPNQVPVNADRLRIEQVLTNLIENGIKYTSSLSTEQCRIDITIAQKDGEIVTSVQDYGLGIPSQQLSQVFDLFFRASNIASANNRYPGMGLGLFIARSIVERHGGRMWVDSVEQQGSTFSFSLPPVPSLSGELDKAVATQQM
jgi:signal transduction histidine kinase